MLNFIFSVLYFLFCGISDCIRPLNDTTVSVASAASASLHPLRRLFSKKEDVDYRQLLPQPGMLPSATLPAAFKMADQDERTPALDKPHHPPREPLAPLNKDPNLSPHHPKVEPSTPVTPVLSEIERSRKLSFNSPHAASWEKFRQKNPEFKEYQRQASTSGEAWGCDDVFVHTFVCGGLLSITCHTFIFVSLFLFTFNYLHILFINI